MKRILVAGLWLLAATLALAQAPAEQQQEEARQSAENATVQNAEAADQTASEPATTEAPGAPEDTAAPASAPAALTLVAEPLYPEAFATSVYSPLAEYLAAGLEREVRLVVPQNFQAHWADIKVGVMHDLAIEAAPLTDYRIRYRDYEILAQAVNPVRYSLVVLEQQYNTRRDLIGHRVAALASPSTSYLFAVRWYDNPLSQPQLITTATSYSEAVQQLWNGEVEGVVLPSDLSGEYPQFKLILESDPIPGIAITASPALPEGLSEEIKALLLALNREEHFPVIDELRVRELAPGNAAAYNGYAEWIRAVSLSGFE